MIHREQIESFLRANGVPPSATDDEIRSLLLSAEWGENEVNTALIILRQNINNDTTHVETLHKVFNTDETLSPQEISQLLGIDFSVSKDQLEKYNSESSTFLMSEEMLILISSVILAIVSVSFFMYSQKIGPFYESESQVYKSVSNLSI